MKINTILALKFIMTEQTVSISIYLESWDISFISRFSETSHLDTSLKTATNLKAKLSIAKALIQFCFAQLSDLTILHLAPFLVSESEKSSLKNPWEMKPFLWTLKSKLLILRMFLNFWVTGFYSVFSTYVISSSQKYNWKFVWSNLLKISLITKLNVAVILIRLYDNVQHPSGASLVEKN